jgi:uncharacterized membrane protein YdjX (TVP38/TMEM64 family)
MITKPRAAVLLLAICVLAGGLAASRIWPAQINLAAAQAAAVARGLGAAGLLLAFLVQLLVAICGVLPASVGAFSCGMAYGIGAGFVISGSATLLAAGLAFLLSRSLLRPLIARMLARHPRIARLEAGVVRDGWRLVALLRCSPVMPFAVTSYAFGLTSISLRAYLLGSLAALPALLGYVVLGALTAAGLAQARAGEARSVHAGLLVLAIAATALLTWRVGAIIKRAMPTELMVAHSERK